MSYGIKEQIDKVIKALELNNMQGLYAENRDAAKELVKSLLNEGDTVSFGGSETLKECGIMELLRGGNYNLLDRAASTVTPQRVQEIYRETFSADAYLCSSNAVTMRGELYNVDGNGNRVAAITFGPKSVIIVAGYNKIVDDIEAAQYRVKTVAAPKNCVRLSKDTPCFKCGQCSSLINPPAQMTDGCRQSGRICSTYVINGRQSVKNRIKVILVGEELGY